MTGVLVVRGNLVPYGENAEGTGQEATIAESREWPLPDPLHMYSGLRVAGGEELERKVLPLAGQFTNVNYVVLTGELQSPKSWDVLAAVGKMPRVRQFALRDASPSDPVRFPAGALGRLEGLEVDGCITDSTLQDIARMGELKVLQVRCRPGSVVSTRGWACLSSLQKLQGLAVEYDRRDDEMLAAISHLRQLRMLSLLGTGAAGSLTDRGVQSLGALKHLEMYEAHWGRTVTPRAADVIASWKNLRYLTLTWDRLDEEALRLVGRHRKLEYLCLRHTNVKDSWLTHLGRLKELKVLDLLCCPLTGDGLPGLAPCSALRVVCANYCVTLSEGAVKLKRMSPGVSYYHDGP